MRSHAPPPHTSKYVFSDFRLFWVVFPDRYSSGSRTRPCRATGSLARRLGSSRRNRRPRSTATSRCVRYPVLGMCVGLCVVKLRVCFDRPITWRCLSLAARQHDGSTSTTGRVWSPSQVDEYGKRQPLVIFRAFLRFDALPWPVQP